MRWSVFKETLSESWVQALYWGAGLGFLGFFVVSILTSLVGSEPIIQFFESLPPVLLKAVGVEGGDLEFFQTPEGLLAAGFFGKMLLIFAAYPVIMGLRVTINEEDNGTMDMLLSLPLPRARVVLEKFLAYTVTSVMIIVLVYIGIWLGGLVTGITFNLGRVAEVTGNLLPTMTFVLAFTVLIGTVTRTRKLALAIASVFVLTSFMLNAIGGVAEGSIAEVVKAVSFFTYYDASNVMRHGLVWSNIIGLMVLSLVMIAASLWVFQRREIAI